MENVDFALIDWSRLQFAVTAMFHWIFVPLTLGLAFIIAIMESIYVKTGNPEWKKITRFWMTLFGINFAIGVATGIILEFEFGTNWSNYSWFVGDIFGAPLAIEGIMAFFLESTFIAVMFFGWNKVSKRFHLVSTWLVAFGANLSALWILVANAWMQSPVGMKFNPDTARNEMINFWEVLFSPVAINKFFHTITSGYVLAAIFVIGISSWYLLKKRHTIFAKRSIVVAAVFGLIMSLLNIYSGDESARVIARVQPMKFAAMEGMYEGQTNAPLVAIGFLEKIDPDRHNINEREFAFSIEIPNMLSYMAFLEAGAYVPGIKNLIHGYVDNNGNNVLPYGERMERGRIAIKALHDYKEAKNMAEKSLESEMVRLSYMEKADSLYALFSDPDWVDNHFAYFGYGYYDDAGDLIPNVPVAFYSFHLMVILGGLFLLIFILTLGSVLRNTIEKRKWLLWLGVLAIPLPYLAGQLGWLLAEMGRQPWVIQDLMPTLSAVTKNTAGNVQITFWMFVFTFTILLIAELKIMLTVIKKGPKEEGGH
ncbi:MAG: cytochrome ubiquinol oxidase subunit I [Bacteroidales bacterium]|nr:cytochrome ubiquinol oxidase subunit I [Bacteroidales bacterium]